MSGVKDEDHAWEDITSREVANITSTLAIPNFRVGWDTVVLLWGLQEEKSVLVEKSPKCKENSPVKNSCVLTDV